MTKLQFETLSPNKLVEVLGATIKKDEENKLICFLCFLSAYTENSQFNISFNAPSSSGKSFIPLEIAKLFPSEDVLILGNCSPTAFFHEQGEYNKEQNTILVDLSRKIIIFLDQPHNALLERLRSLLSHDQKEMQSKITDKNQKGGNRTKTVILRGYPSVVFCSAGLKIDEQEATRFFLLSPEINQDKIRAAILSKIEKESDNDKYQTWLDEIPERRILKDRILSIRDEHINEIKIGQQELITERFLSKYKFLKPRHQRDIAKLISLIKANALLNLWDRERQESTITANEEDITFAFEIWDKIFVSQELSIPPYIHQIYLEIILPLWEVKTKGLEDLTDRGLSRQDIIQKHYEVNGRVLDNIQLRQQILPMLESAGLIRQEPHSTDRRKYLVYPNTQHKLEKEDENEIIIEAEDSPF